MNQTYNNSKINILNVPVTAIALTEIFNKIDFFIGSNEKKKVIGYSNLHGLYLAIKNTDLQLFYNTADINYIDGLPLVWIANVSGFKVANDKRITFLDVALNFLKHCKINGYKVLWIGGEEESIQKGIENIKMQIPNVGLQGVNGFKSDSDYLAIVESFKPNVIILGLGMPRQEAWVLRNLAQLDVNVIWCVGATIDYISGKVYSPPRWSGRVGLEWFFRFLSEPKRMFSRYFIESFIVMFYLIKRKSKEN